MTTTAYAVRFAPQALDSLHEAADFIEERSGPERAAAWLRAMQEAIGDLRTMPTAFAIVGRRLGRELHSKPVLSHRVFYFVDEPTRIVYVIDVVHTARETKLADYRDDGSD